MHNPHIECLIFEAKTLDGQMPIHLRFNEITEVNTSDNIFYFKDGLHEPVACQYDSLHLLEPDEVIEARLKVAQG